jgi:hypothetical protein
MKGVPMLKHEEIRQLKLMQDELLSIFDRIGKLVRAYEMFGERPKVQPAQDTGARAE